MLVSDKITNAFADSFQNFIAEFTKQQGLINKLEDITSTRFLSRSIVPHVKHLSSLFNRKEDIQTADLSPYWASCSNPANLRLAYFLYFMPSNLFRIASVWSELSRLGFTWKGRNTLNGIEIGAGPASGACGVMAGECFSGINMPPNGTWALIDRDKPMLKIGEAWARYYFSVLGCKKIPIRSFHRQIDIKEGFLPPSAKGFNLLVMSYFLNEMKTSQHDIAKSILKTFEKNFEHESVFIIVEPALRHQSRALLELRSALLSLAKHRGINWLKIILPCLGHQNCGALASTDDWCHEEVSWMRPPYFKLIDRMAGLDRKSLAFSYLVMVKSNASIEELIPNAFPNHNNVPVERLVSPVHKTSRGMEFYVCSKFGKKKLLHKPSTSILSLQRGDIITTSPNRGIKKVAPN